MNFTLVALRRLLGTFGLVALALLPLSNCGGGTEAPVSDTAASSSVPPEPAAPMPPVSESIIETPRPEPAPTKGSSDHWGVAPSSDLSRRPETWLKDMADAGVTTVRNFDDNTANDRLAPILAAGLSATGILQWTPVSLTLPVNDLEGWRNYVSATVRRYKGRVKYWEIWNEAPNFTADTSPVSYGKVVAAAYDAAKAVDPKVQIGLATKSNYVNFLAEALDAGAADKFDFVTLHPYENAEQLPLGWEGQFIAIVPRLRKMLQVKNPAKADVPVWFTEIGISAAPPEQRGVGPQMQADVLAKIYTMAFAQGVRRVYWFDPADSEGMNMGLVTADGTRRPAWHAMRALSRHIGPRPRYVGWVQPDQGFYGFVFNGPRGVVLVAWARPGDSVPLSLASAVSVVDPHTGDTSNTHAPVITEKPSILVAPDGSPQAAAWRADASANIDKPFPWNGDHSRSRVVRMTAGGSSDGVFIVKPPPITVVNNIAEYNLHGGIGACFTVDPTFLSYAYTSTPVQITVQLRAHGTGTPGFEFRYESGAPIAATDINNLKLVSSGWYAVPGTGWVEKTWNIPDARFIGLYGYHFCLYAPDPQVNSTFSVRQVTVRR